jgi:3-hydroxymyristoyl/3-hydroxydecanoyl-(acyl carrier protein) dehydratase
MADADAPITNDQVFAFTNQAISRILPHRKEMALLDRIEAYSPRDRTLIGIKAVTQNEPVLEGHFPDQPIFPGTLIIEALAQASGIMINFACLSELGVQLDRLDDETYIDTLPPPPLTVLADSKIQQFGLVYPGDSIRLESRLTIRRKDMGYFEVRALVNGEVVAKGTMLIALPDYVPTHKPSGGTASDPSAAAVRPPDPPT